jgi:uncharacterized protein YxjI
MFRHHDEGPPSNAYQLRQQMFSIGDDYWIENGAGVRVYKVDGKALRARKTLVLQDAAGRDLFTIQEVKLSVRDSMEIHNDSGKIASVHKKMISPLRDHYVVEHVAGKDWNSDLAEVSKKWFRARDTYGIEIVPDQHDALVLAVAIVVDTMSNPGN